MGICVTRSNASANQHYLKEKARHEDKAVVGWVEETGFDTIETDSPGGENRF